MAIDCRDNGDAAAVYAAVHGSGPDALRRFNPNRECMGLDPKRLHKSQGSFNYAPPFRAVLGDVPWLADLCRAWRTGWFSRELGSGLYSPIVVASLVLGLRDARGEDAAELRHTLRAYWTLAALHTVLSPPRTVVWHHPGLRSDPKRIDVGYQAGCWQPGVGDRWNYPAAEIGAGPLQVAWALDLPRRHRKMLTDPMVPKGLEDMPRYKASYQGWYAAVQLFGLMAGQDGRAAPFEHTLDPALFGLTADERVTLLAVATGNVVAAAEAFEWIKDVRVLPQAGVWSLTRTRDGAEAFRERIISPHKPGINYSSITNDGDLVVVMPSHFKRGGAKKSTASRDERQVRAQGDAGEYVVPRLGGEALWEIDFTEAGPRVARGQLAGQVGGAPVAPPPPPVKPPPGPKPPPKPEEPGPEPGDRLVIGAGWVLEPPVEGQPLRTVGGGGGGLLLRSTKRGESPRTVALQAAAGLPLVSPGIGPGRHLLDATASDGSTVVLVIESRPDDTLVYLREHTRRGRR